MLNPPPEKEKQKETGSQTQASSESEWEEAWEARPPSEWHTGIGRKWQLDKMLGESSKHEWQLSGEAFEFEWAGLIEYRVKIAQLIYEKVWNAIEATKKENPAYVIYRPFQYNRYANRHGIRYAALAHHEEAEHFDYSKSSTSIHAWKKR